MDAEALLRDPAFENHLVVAVVGAENVLRRAPEFLAASTAIVARIEELRGGS